MLAVAVLLLLCSIMISQLSGGTTVSSSSKVRASLQRYEQLGLFRPSLFDASSGFLWPKIAFDYGVNMSIDEVVKRMEAAQSKHVGPNEIDLSFAEFANQVGLLFTKGTKFEGKFQLNRAPRDDFINLYILDDDPEKIAKHFRRNCEYIGYYNAIICDAQLFKMYFAFVDAIQKTYDIAVYDRVTRTRKPIEGNDLSEVKSGIKLSIVVWVLGHEIGHALFHKDILLRENIGLHFDFEYNKYEQEADGFVAQGLIGDWPLATKFWISTGEFVHQEFRRIYREQAPKDDSAISTIDSQDFVIENEIAVPYSKYHVPMILRAVRIVNKLIEAVPKIDSTGYYRAVADNMNVVIVSPDRHIFWLLFAGASLLGCAGLVYLLLSETRQRRSTPNVDHG